MVHKFIITEKASEMVKSKIQNNIRTLRFHADEMTQQELADQARVSRQTIVAIEKGNYSPSLELAFRLAHIFKTPLEEVFTYDPDNTLPNQGK
jgi:putative transcriptional regulator